jgi:hypothetical protein
MAANRYWRIFNYWVDENLVCVTECQLRESEGGADVTGAGTASCSSTLSAPTYDSDKAFDDNTGTLWASANGSYIDQWLAYDFGSGNNKDIVEVYLLPQSGYPNRTPREFELQYSDDGSNWTKKYEFREISWTNDAQVFNASNESASLDFAPHRMTSNSTPSPYVISSDGAYYSEYFAFNGKFTGAALGCLLSTYPSWLKLDLGAGNAKSLTSYSIYAYEDANRIATGWDLHGSTDDSNWDLLDSRTSQTPWSTYARKDYALGAPTAEYRYFRFTINTCTVDATYVGIGEIFLYEPEPAVGPPEKAADPDPYDDETGVAIDETLSWTDGGGATSYDVYFGTETGDLDSIGNQAGTTYDPGELEYDTEYFWRIDAVNDDGTTEGDEWSFTTRSEIVPSTRKATAVTVIC